MRKWFWLSLLTETTKEKYTHQRLLELYIQDPYLWRSYLHTHIWYFISHARWNVDESDYYIIASEAINLIDQQIIKQLKKYPDWINAVKMWRYLIMRLWWHLMNNHLASIKEQVSPYDEEHQYLSCNIWYDDFDDSLSSIGLSEIEQIIVSMKIKWHGEREIMKECDSNRATIRRHYENWLEKVRRFYLSQWIGNEASIKTIGGGLSDQEDQSNWAREHYVPARIHPNERGETE